jgi:drug/metabolite transporter (DMT)-like permease
VKAFLGMALPVAGLLAMGIGWGGNILLAKLATSLGAPPVGLALLEAGGSGLILLLALRARRQSLPLDLASLRFYVISGASGVVIPNVVIFYTVPHLPVGLLAIAMTLIPLLTYGFSLLLRIESFGWLRSLGLLFGFIGVMLILAPSSSLPERGMTFWVVVGFGATSMYALQNVYVAHAWPREGDALALSCGGLLASGMMLAPLAPFAGGFVDLTPPWSAMQWSGLAMTAINAALTVIFIASIRRVGPVFTSQTAYLITLSGVVWGMLLLGERHSPWIWSAMLVMCAGVALVTLRPREIPA